MVIPIMMRHSLYFLLFTLFLFLPSLAACAGGSQVLGLNRKEAVERLHQGDIGFILEASLKASIDENAPFSKRVLALASLGKISPQAPYYAGLLAQAAGEKETAAILFSLALDSPSGIIREESAGELLLPVLEGDRKLAGLAALKLAGKPLQGNIRRLKAGVLYSQGLWRDADSLLRGEESPWERALLLLIQWRRSPEGAWGEEFQDFFLGRSPDEAWHWAWRDFQRNGGVFPAGIETLLEGKDSAAAARYPEALAFFRPVLETSPEVFFAYPELLAELGRAFQYSPQARNEGAELLAHWGEATPGNSSEELSPESRYYSLFYAARIYRLLQNYPKAESLFSQALELAPNPLQRDACIWYLLHIALTWKPAEASGVMKTLLPRSYSPPYFSDVLDQLSRYLAGEGRWSEFEGLLPILQSYAAPSIIAQYAWIAGRAIEEGFIPPLESSAESFYRIALEQRGAGFYYRFLAARRLGESVLPGAEDWSLPANAPVPEEAEFFLNFFEFGAGSLMMPRLRQHFKAVPPEAALPSLRFLAGTLGERGLWQPAREIVLYYTGLQGRDFYPPRADLLLRYPLPYRELTEKYAALFGIEPYLLQGLIFQESAFNHQAVSRSGALGLTQLMPATAMETAGRIVRFGGPEYRQDGTIDLFEPERNIHIGAAYFAQLMELLDNPLLALLAYNGGIGRVRRWLSARPLPPDLFLETVDIEETRDYGRRVLAAAGVYAYLYYGLPMEIPAIYADMRGE